MHSEMGPIRKTFRVFVSSTFSDLKAERNALQEHVFPRIRALCEQHGARFQAIDLRWGVSTEAALDQQTMNICLGEIARCQEITPRPNFLILLGDRYGWRPLPAQIPGEEFRAIFAESSQEERDLLQTWYRRDDNAVPPAYMLQARVQGGSYQQLEAWAPVEARLRSILERAAESLALDRLEGQKYWASATHQEIAAGAMEVEDAEKHVLCFVREIEGLPHDQAAAEYLDLNEEGDPDQEAAARLRKLKEELSSRLAENFIRYRAGWEKGGLSRDHLEQFCDAVYARLSDLILREAGASEAWDSLEEEIAAHRQFGAVRTQTFIGREGALAAIRAYIDADSRYPLVVGGVPGSGKSALIARAAEQAEIRFPETKVMVRFIGATPSSSSGRELLESLCLQISQAYGLDDSNIPSSYRELELDFRARLSSATRKNPLVLFLDALDQLSPGDKAQRLQWLPRDLPDHVSLIVSTVPGEIETRLHNKLPRDSQLRIEDMSLGEAQLLLNRWLKDAGRTLQDVQREEILTGFKACPQPLYLKLAFAEARRWTSYAGIPEGADGQPGLSDDIAGVLRDLFARLSSEVQHGEPLVKHSLGYIASSKHGLTEDELLDVLSRDVGVLVWFLQGIHHIPPGLVSQVRSEIEKAPQDLGWERPELPDSDETVEAWLNDLRKDPDGLRSFLTCLLKKKTGINLPVVLWSRLYSDLEPYLTKRAAEGALVMDYYHRQVGEVVKETFLKGDEGNWFHQRLAEYFKRLEIQRGGEGVEANLRMLVELPYQQVQARLWEELKKTLSDYLFLHVKTEAIGPQQLVRDYDQALQAGYESRLFSSLAGAVRLSANILRDDPGQLPSVFLGRLLEDPDPAIRKFLKQVKKWERTCWLRPRTPNLAAPGGALLRTLIGHQGSVTGVRTGILESGQVISAGEDQTLRVWDLDSGDLVSSFRGEAPILAMDLLADAREVIYGTADGAIYVTELDTGKSVQRLTGHRGAVREIVACSDGARILSASEDQTLRLWDLAAGKELLNLSGHDGPVRTAAVSADGRMALSGSDDRTLRLWDLESGEIIHILHGHEAPVTAAAFLAGGKQAISGAFNTLEFSRAIKVWDLESGKEVRTIQDRTWGVHALLPLPEKGQAAAAIMDGTIKLINTEKGYIRRTLEGHVAEALDLALSKSGDRLISSSKDGTLKIWDYRASTARGEGLFDLTLPEGHRQLKRRWARYEPAQAGYHALSVGALAVFPNRGRAVSITNIHLDSSDSGCLSRLAEWDLKSGMRIRTQELSVGEITATAVSPGGERVLIACENNSVRIVDLASGQIQGQLQAHTGLITGLAISPEGLFAASASHDRSVRLWDLQTRKERCSLQGHNDAVTAVAIFPGGRRMVTGSADCTLKLWDLNSQRVERTLTGHQGAVRGLAILPGGRVVSGSDDMSLKIWDAAQGRLLATLPEHQGAVTGVGVLAEGQYVVSASDKGSIKVWNLDSGQVLAAFTGEDAFRCLASKPDGLSFIAGDEQGRTHILQLAGSC